jgi:hypothetical protein
MDTETSGINILRMYSMPMVGSVGAPFFGGKNIIKFLERFEDLCLDYEVSDEQKVVRIIRYYSLDIRYYLRTIPAVISGD